MGRNLLYSFSYIGIHTYLDPFTMTTALTTDIRAAADTWQHEIWLKLMSSYAHRTPVDPDPVAREEYLRRLGLLLGALPAQTLDLRGLGLTDQRVWTGRTFRGEATVQRTDLWQVSWGLPHVDTPDATELFVLVAGDELLPADLLPPAALRLLLYKVAQHVLGLPDQK